MCGVDSIVGNRQIDVEDSAEYLDWPECRLLLRRQERHTPVDWFQNRRERHACRLDRVLRAGGE